MKKYSYYPTYLLSIAFFLIIFSIPITSEASCDVGSVYAQNARRGLAGTDFGNASIADCEAQNSYSYPTSDYDNSYIDYLTEQEVKRLEAERDQKLNSIKLNFDKECKEKKTGPNSHFDEKFGCVCNVGYQLLDGICQDKNTVFDKKFDKYYYLAISNLPEYKDIVDKDYIKNLAQDPNNSKLTITELIKITYSKNVQGEVNNSEVVSPVRPLKLEKQVTEEIVTEMNESEKTDSEEVFAHTNEPQKKSIFKKVIHFISFGWLFK